MNSRQVILCLIIHLYGDCSGINTINNKDKPVLEMQVRIKKVLGSMCQAPSVDLLKAD
jgi:hypothetical protein